ncbi:MAG: HNH endonuclease [Lachnospiraceae bacterium]|nr:HNH endonuclease [Ruminococcus sp.]MCM1276326.1 HNH endonuclease [Lachnospiraceae bacterium]
MPYRAKRPCAYPGCPRLADKTYCTEHGRLVNAQYERYGRSPETAARYGKAWRIIRRRYIAAHPLCEECLRRGLAIPAEHVHHIVPLADGGINDESNLMSLCKSCHSRIHMKMRRG